MATGDRAGRIVLFKADDSAKDNEAWVPFYQFQSHDTEVDHLNSLEVEAKINQLQFVPSAGERVLILSANDKHIKLWRVGESSVYEPCASECLNRIKTPENLRLPQITDDFEIFSTLKRSYNNAHSYHINHIELNCHDESFISNDDLRINLWRFEDHRQGLNIVDIKPKSMEDLSEVITSTAFHPKEGNIFAYSTSRGCIKVHDLRQSTICNKFRLYESEKVDSKSETGFGSELISSISDIKFSPDGKYMVTRDYMTLKVWDVYNTGKPVEVIPVHPQLEPLLSDLYEAENIFDKFTTSVSQCSTMALTGSYNNKFMIKGLDGSTIYQSSLPDVNGTVKSWDDNQDIDTEERVVYSAWHPSGRSFAVAGMCSLHLYSI